MSNKQRYHTTHEGVSVQLVEGKVIETGDVRFVAVIEETTVSGELRVYVPLSTAFNQPPTRPFGHGISTSGSSSHFRLEGDLNRPPRRNEKVLMLLLFSGTEGFKCIGWTFKAIADATHTIEELSHAVIEGQTV